MTLFNRRTAAQSLNNLLEQERMFLLAGDLNALAKLAPEKERLFKLIPTVSLDAKTLREMAQKADRNQALLLAANKGIRAVSRRIEALRNHKSQLRTYDAGGQRQDLGHPTSKFEKRA